MRSDPIRIIVRSKAVSPAPIPPLLTSDQASWEGIRLEMHDMPRGEMPERYSFDRHIVVMNCGSNSYRKYWRKNGREQSVLVRPGDVGLISRQEIVGNHWAPGGVILVAALNSQALTEPLQDELSGRVAEFAEVPAVEDPVLRRMLIHLRAEVVAGCPAGCLYGESIVTALAGYAVPRYGTVRPVLKGYRQGLSAPRLRRVLDYIDASLSANIGIRELATLAGLSSYHFGKLFKRSMGRSVHQYVLDCRIARACDLIRKKSNSFAAIGAEIGILNPSNFSAMFHSRVGMSPRQFRQCLLSR